MRFGVSSGSGGGGGAGGAPPFRPQKHVDKGGYRLSPRDLFLCEWC